ncbi:MAG: S-layer homology domain-containing protein [Peptoniphilus harei]|nr:S-layer homology domain-containing protein [Peptoniphilus harei]
MKNIKKLCALIIAFAIVITSFSPISVLAEESEDTSAYFGVTKEEKYTVKEQTGTLCKGNGENKVCKPIYKEVEKTRDVFINKLDEIMNENYWSYLKKVQAENLNIAYDDNYNQSEEKTSFNITIPEYVLEPDETAIKDYPHHEFEAYRGVGWYNFGINPKWTGCNIAIVALMMNDDGSLKYGPKDNEDFFVEAMKRHYTIPTQDGRNPYNFTEKDLLTKDEVKNAVDLRFKADIKKIDSKDSKKIDELKKGEAFDLDCKINADWFKRLFNFQILGIHLVGQGEDLYNYVMPNSYIKSDAGISFALYLPKGVEIDDTNKKVELSGLEGFTATIEKKEGSLDNKSGFSRYLLNKNNEEQPNVLLVSVRKNEKGVTKTEKEIVEKVNNLNTSNINLKISGLKVSDNVPLNKNITIVSSVGGFYDFALSPQEKFYTYGLDNQGIEENKMPADRFYWSFAAVQDPAGLDEAAPEDKPNLISYTFKVKEGEVTPTPTPEPEPTPIPEPEIKPPLKIHEYTPTYPVYASVDKKEVETKEVINTHDQYIFGYPDDTIRPDGDMTRAEAIAVVARLQKLDLSDKSSKIYKDTKADMWYNGAINAAYREGYLLEKEGENIRPNDKITRAELAELISHIDKKNNAIAPFEDVKGHKFEAAINQAYGNERIKGYPDGTFKPDNTITRAEVATMLNKLYDRYPDEKFIDANQNAVHNYKDMSYKGHWGYYELVEAYHSHKYLRLSNNMEEWKDIIK